jgi:hypothetical protein
VLEHEHTRNWNQVHLLGKMATMLVAGKEAQAAVLSADTLARVQRGIFHCIFIA